jgi:Ca-activated chloride channel family protein
MFLLWPAMLVSLLLLPLLVALYLRAQGRRRQLAARYGGLGLVRGAAAPGGRRHVPPALFLAALALLCVALARPQATISLPRLEGTVMLVFDVSGSMAAADLAPSRLDAAKAAALDFVEKRAPELRVGVVAFSDGGITVQMPTSGQEEILTAIERLAPQRGTSVGEGIFAALTAIAVDADEAPADPAAPAVELERYPSASIILLSDGENNAEPDPVEAALQAAAVGVRVYTVGVGTTAGATLDLDGFSVHTMLDEAALQQIALASGGSYYGAADGLMGINDELSSRLTVRAEATEITALFVGAGFILLLVGGLCSLLWFNRLA